VSAISNNQDATSSIQNYKDALNSLSQLSSQNSAVYQTLKSEMDAAGLNLSFTLTDIQNFLNSVLTTGFPPDELTVFNELGISPSEILAILMALDPTDVPTSLDAAFDQLASTESQIAAGFATTPVPAALPLFATGLGAMGLLGWRRKRKNTAAITA
jgi:lambda repressor-like predicted transcriptional regulator